MKHTGKRKHKLIAVSSVVTDTAWSRALKVLENGGVCIDRLVRRLKSFEKRLVHWNEGMFYIVKQARRNRQFIRFLVAVQNAKLEQGIELVRKWIKEN